ncbi:MAG: hypothetical protein CVT82_03665 [Alphaproteobacteria bacterium HGW-Alphaproteobacteria-4]|jgi:hypothetical protein|nr:MAG: hypothetical protein CVT82_03665 [Alphaproteobacteria bacterium HGW-Alphaproteobacteria-4]
MIVILAAIIGALLGYRQAHRRGGNGFDHAQFAAVYGIVFALIGMFATLAIDRFI